MGWYNASWNKRIKIDGTNYLRGDATSFINDMLTLKFVNADSSGFWTGRTRGDGGDIRVTSDDGTTEIPVHVSYYNLTDQVCIINFNPPGYTSRDTSYYIYYDNSGASEYATTATYGRNNVYSMYKAFWWLNHDPTGNPFECCTGNSNDLSIFQGSFSSSNVVTSLYGKGLDFTGSQVLTAASRSLSRFQGSFMWEAHINADSLSSYGGVIDTRYYDSAELDMEGYTLYTEGGNQLSFWRGRVNNQSFYTYPRTSGFTTGTDHHLSVYNFHPDLYLSSVGYVYRSYDNGSAIDTTWSSMNVSTSATGHPNLTQGHFAVGSAINAQSTTPAYFFDGVINFVAITDNLDSQGNAFSHRHNPEDAFTKSTFESNAASIYIPRSDLVI